MTAVQKLLFQFVKAKFKFLSAVSKTIAARQAFDLFCTPQQRTKIPRTELFNKADQLQFQLQGNTIRGYRWNAGGAKKLLILHGFESSVSNFGHFIEPLAQKGYEVLAFDAPAHGYSDGKKITVLLYKEMIKRIAGQFGPIDAYIAHSFGGLTLSLALEEIPHSRNTRVVYIAPAVETTTASDNFFGLLDLPANLRPAFENRIREVGGHTGDWFSLRRASANTDAEVLFLQDKQDQQTPYSDVETLMKENRPNIRFVVTEGLGHRRIYKDASSLKTILEFL